MGGGGVPRGSWSGLGAGSGVISGTFSARLAASQLALQCPTRKLTLIDVIQRGNRVALLGAADKSLIGRKVTITLVGNHKRVASAVVGTDGGGHQVTLGRRRLAPGQAPVPRHRERREHDEDRDDPGERLPQVVRRVLTGP